MRQFGIAAGLLAALVAGTPPAWAQDPIHKMGRGLTNVLTGWLELPKQVHLGSRDENPVTGMGRGFFRGTSLTVLRTGVGLFETVTFPIAYPDAFGSPYEPMELHDYAWE